MIRHAELANKFRKCMTDIKGKKFKEIEVTTEMEILLKYWKDASSMRRFLVE
jgi:hypothetical protein